MRRLWGGLMTTAMILVAMMLMMAMLVIVVFVSDLSTDLSIYLFLRPSIYLSRWLVAAVILSDDSDGQRFRGKRSPRNSGHGH